MARTAVIAGVGPGLGESLARRFAREGCQVALFARTADFIEGLIAHGHIETGTHAAVTYWESMDAFESWTESDAFEEAHRDPPPEEWFTEEGGLEIHEVAFDARES